MTSEAHRFVTTLSSSHDSTKPFQDKCEKDSYCGFYGRSDTIRRVVHQEDHSK